MTTPSDGPDVDSVVRLLENGATASAVERVRAIRTDPVDDRKAAMRELRAVAEDRPALLGPLCPALVTLLEDGERSIRLSTAKLLVAIAAADPESVSPVGDQLAERLADEGEFYYVRARSAEALGYVAREVPEAVTSPELLADLRVGLALDEPEVREKLAKALASVALGAPDRLRHRVADLAAHLDGESDLVRYHLATAVVATGCAHPEAIADARDELVERLDDECTFVRGRAVEALGVLARSEGEETASVSRERLETLLDTLDGEEEGTAFVAERVRFALNGTDGGSTGGDDETTGTLAGIGEHTDTIAEEIRTPDRNGCPRCGFAEGSGPMCPRCGAPR